MKLTRRLQAIEDFLPNDCILADIGCDHAYLACDACLKGIVKKAYACDVAAGPIHAATSTIQELQLTEKVIPLLSDGLENVPEDANVCVIAGMGVETMKMILANEKIKQFSTLILQPNNDADEMRKWAYSHHLNLVDETVVHEHHYYFILKYTNEAVQPLSETELEFGKFCTHEQTYRDYWQFRKDRLESILSQMNESEKKAELSHLLERINRQLTA